MRHSFEFTISVSIFPVISLASGPVTGRFGPIPFRTPGHFGRVTVFTGTYRNTDELEIPERIIRYIGKGRLIDCTCIEKKRLRWFHKCNY